MVHLVDALPVTGSGKVLKTALRGTYRVPARATTARPLLTAHPTSVQVSTALRVYPPVCRLCVTA